MMMITIKLRDRLVRAANKAGRTFSEEIQQRLNASFENEPDDEMPPLTDEELEHFRETPAYDRQRREILLALKSAAP